MYKHIYFIISISLSICQISDLSYSGAEVSAMSGAVVSIESDDHTIFHNPAGMTEINTSQFSSGGGKLYGYNWLTYYYLTAIIQIPLIGKTGVGIQQLDTKYNGISLSSEDVISFAKGFNLQLDKNSHLSVGYTANLIMWNMANSAGVSGDGSDGLELGSSNTFTIDFGVLGSLRNKYRFGVFIKNLNSGAIGKGITRQILTKKINTGITYIPIEGLYTSIATEYILGYEELQIKGSMQYRLNSLLTIYTGAQAKPNRFGIGTKFTFNKYNICYSLLTHPILPITHQIKIGLIL